MRALKLFLLPFVFMFAVCTAMKAGPVDKYGLLQIKQQNGRPQLCSEEGKGGNAIQLRGMSLFWSMWGPAWWNESSMDQAVDFLGCEIIRVPLGIGDNLAPSSYIITGSYLDGAANKAINLARVEMAVHEAIYKDIYVIIDWHDSHAEDHQAAAIEFFQKMADEYGNDPHVLFEIYNEPVSDWTTKIKPYAEAVIGAIRAKGANNVIIVGTPGYSQLGQSVIDNPISDQSNIAYTFHFYAAASAHYLNSGPVGLAAKAALDSKKLCIIATEWGTTNYDGKSLDNKNTDTIDKDHSQEWVDWMKDNKITWCNWALDDTDQAVSIFKVDANNFGPWNNDLLRNSGRYLLLGVNEDGINPPLPAPTTSLVVSPSLLYLKATGSEGKTTHVVKGTFSDATSSDPTWLNVLVSQDKTTLTITADNNDDKTNDRSGYINLTNADSNGNKARVKVIQVRNDGNLALFQPVKATSQQGSYRAANAVDGDEINTRWGSYFTDGKHIPAEDLQGITIDLGKDRSFGKIVLVWEPACAKRYVIETAPDQGSDDVPANSKFSALYYSPTITTADRKTGNPSANPPIPPLGYTDTINTGRTARWVRMSSLERATIWGVSLFEFKIFKVPYILAEDSRFPIYAGVGSNQTLLVQSNTVWTAAFDWTGAIDWTGSTETDWAHIDPATGGSDDDPPPPIPLVRLTFDENLGGTNRTAILTYKGNGASSKPISLTQPAETRIYRTYKGSDIYLNPSITNSVNNPDGTMDVDIGVSCNWSWTAQVVKSSWLTITSSINGDGNGSIHVHASAIAGGADRTALVVFQTPQFPLLADVWVTQQQKQVPPNISVDPSIFLPVPSDGKSLSTTVTSNTTWKVTSKPDWITVSPTEGNSGDQSVTLTVSPNTGSDRLGTITFSCDDSTVSATVNINQAGVAQPETWYASGGGDQRSITVTRTGSWTAYSSASNWLWVSYGNGWGNGSIFMTASPNTTGKTRTATVTITGGGNPITILVTQDPLKLSITPSDLKVSVFGGTSSFTIASNTYWWSAYTQDGGGILNINTGSYSGSGNGTVYFTVSKNTTGNDRIFHITVIGGGVGGSNVPNQTVTITQAGK